MSCWQGSSVYIQNAMDLLLRCVAEDLFTLHEPRHAHIPLFLMLCCIVSGHGRQDVQNHCTASSQA